ncbi:MAG: protein BatD [Gammaproteobacteria bacterium]|nr:protein BatD [Gammaproteobacteria bacterium]MBL6998821.1 protein BatD [Gammaproteobacteria bacterium]
MPTIQRLLTASGKTLLPGIMLCLFAISVFAARIEVSSDRNPVNLNESFKLVYESADAVDDDPDFTPLEAQLDILHRGQSSNVSIINGRYSSSKTWTLSVIARKPGKLTLPAIKFGADSSPALQISVQETPVDQQAQTGFYTRIEVDQQQVYAQQQLVITQQILSAQKLASYGMDKLNFNGMDVLIEPLGKVKQYQTQIADQSYHVIEQRYALFPQTSGLLKVQPVLVEARTGNGSGIFFDTFGNSRGKLLRAYSNELSVAVLPLPASINVNPWLPAKEFQLSEQWAQDPPQFIQGEPLTRTLSIKAEGLTAAQLPPLPDMSMDGLKQYPDQPLLNDVANDTGMTGYRVEKVALIPTRAGSMTLPAIEIAWWNTRTQMREIARIPARKVQVQAAAKATVVTTVTPAAAAPTAMAPLASATAPPELTPEIPASTAPTVLPDDLFSNWKWVAILLAVGWLLTLVGWLLVARRKRPAVAVQAQPARTGVEQHLKWFKASCTVKDVAGCRTHLLNWAKAFYPQQKMTSVSDLQPMLDARVAQEIRKLDAVLYGGQTVKIDFQLIVEQIARLHKAGHGAASKAPAELLEPLYR